MKQFYSIIFLVFSLLSLQNAIAGNGNTTYPLDRSVLDSSIQPFYHGIASGDPLNDRVIIWTRVTTDSAVVPVLWRMATDTGMQNIVAEGRTTADTARDF